MCNNLHTTSTPIPEEGVAWKIFRSFNSSLEPVFSYSSYKNTTDGWITWRSSSIGDGFCAFPTFEEAKKLLIALKGSKKNVKKEHAYSDCVIRKIKYKQGVGQHREYCIIGNGEGYMTIIVKSFCIEKES